MTPTVSVFLPTYQHRAFIADALDSVLAQDGCDFEIVVGDDGSTDGTREIVAEYAARHPGVVVPLLSPVNTGITANQNRVLAACRGEFIAFFAGDDLWLPGKLRKQLAWFAEHPDAVICYTNVEEFDSDTGRRLRLQHMPGANPFREGSVEQLFLSPAFFNGTSAMARRSACPPHGYEPSLSIVSDWLFWVETAINGRVGFVPEVLARYRRHAHNITNGVERIVREQLLALDLVERRHPQLAELAAGLRPRLLWGGALGATKRGDYALAHALLASLADWRRARGAAMPWRERVLPAVLRLDRRRLLGRLASSPSGPLRALRGRTSGGA